MKKQLIFTLFLGALFFSGSGTTLHQITNVNENPLIRKDVAPSLSFSEWNNGKISDKNDVSIDIIVDDWGSDVKGNSYNKDSILTNEISITSLNQKGDKVTFKNDGGDSDFITLKENQTVNSFNLTLNSLNTGDYYSDVNLFIPMKDSENTTVIYEYSLYNFVVDQQLVLNFSDWTVNSFGTIATTVVDVENMGSGDYNYSYIDMGNSIVYQQNVLQSDSLSTNIIQVSKNQYILEVNTLTPDQLYSDLFFNLTFVIPGSIPSNSKTITFGYDLDNLETKTYKNGLGSGAIIAIIAASLIVFGLIIFAIKYFIESKNFN